MGFNNPRMSWSELERRLADRQPSSEPTSGHVQVPDRHLDVPKRRGRVPGGYAELHCHSNFSFLDGASHPEELAREAARLGLDALAITDHDGMYGVVRFAEAAAEVGMPTVFGAELSLGLSKPQNGITDPEGNHLVVLARDADGYRRLCRAITRAQLAGKEKGRPQYDFSALGDHAGGHWLILTGCRKGLVPAALAEHGPRAAARALADLVAVFGRENVVVELWDHGDPLDSARNDVLVEIAIRQGVDVVATNNVHYATPAQRPLATALAAVRARRSLDDMDGWLPPAATAHLRSPAEQARRFARYPGVVERAAEVGRECAFDLRLVAPRLPDWPVPKGHTEMSWLRELTERGATTRYGPRSAERVPGAYRQIDHELDLIERLGFPGYFLIVWDIVEFCRRSNILCQGRGSAANSAVCYALGITNADAVSLGLLFERFLSPERDGPPDIDLDIESDRREEAIQYVYERYGRENAAQVANVITYRPRSAVRDMGKALGFATGQLDAWSKQIDAWGPLQQTIDELRLSERTRDASNAAAREAPATSSSRAARSEFQRATQSEAMSAAREAPATSSSRAARSEFQRATQSEAISTAVPQNVLDLALQVEGFPRHLGIHSGGMVICDRPVSEVVPVEWGRMENRSVLQWDKDDCAAAGLVKFDLLGLGMLSAIHYAIDLIAEYHGVDVDLAALPQEDAVYEMLCRADSVGVFQVESRAQMATLPRLKPRCFYDLVVEVALIRPGPIQGDSVHPYIRRRNGIEPVTYLHPLLEPALEKTLGIPLFQEQLMQMAIDVAGFSAGEADQLRQAMGSKRSTERMERLRARFYAGMEERGITGDTADTIWDKLAAFANYGFPESHSVSFAYLVYASAWIKLHYPDAFLAALLNAQPMGFYSPQSLVADARRHGVEVLGVDVNESAAKATLVNRPGDPHHKRWAAVRLGIESVRGIGDDLAQRIAEGRPYSDAEDVVRRCALNARQMEALATAGAFGCFDLDRREALWVAGAAAQAKADTLPGMITGDEPPALPVMAPLEDAAAEMWATSVSTTSYPTEFVRSALDELGVIPAARLADSSVEDGSRVLVGGVVTHRQRPATAGGTVFLNLEDETGLVNVVFAAGLWLRERRVARTCPALLIRGRVEKAEGVINVVAEKVEPLPMSVTPAGKARDFR